jgi:hypothetical protein
VTKSRSNPAFDLLSNPFTLLDVTPEANARQVEEALADALDDQLASETQLQSARQVLLTSRLRLHAEVSYLLDLDPSAARAIIDSLGSGMSIRFHYCPRIYAEADLTRPFGEVCSAPIPLKKSAEVVCPWIFGSPLESDSAGRGCWK